MQVVFTSCKLTCVQSRSEVEKAMRVMSVEREAVLAGLAGERGAAERAAALHSHDQAITFYEQALALTSDPAEQAAWTLVANALLNLDETFSKE